MRLAAEIEDAHVGRPRFDIEHRAFVTNAVLSSVAFMEAAINELFQDAFDLHQPYIEPLDSEVQALLAQMWDWTEARNKAHFNVLDKYGIALVLARKETISTDGQLFENAHLLVRLRNELMHYNWPVSILPVQRTYPSHTQLKPSSSPSTEATVADHKERNSSNAL